MEQDCWVSVPHAENFELELRGRREIMKKSRQGKLVPVGLTVIFLILLGFTRAGAAADTRTIRSSYGGTAGYQLPIWVVKEAGLYKKYGVELEVILIEGGSVNIQALLGGAWI